MPLPMPPFYFSLFNVDHYQSNDLIYCSEPFYSHPGGYKMMITVCPNGFGDTKHMYMGVYANILRGEFDDQLRWPFDGSVTVQAYNRTTEQWSNKHIIVMNKAECGLKYVSRCMDLLRHGSWGFANFLHLSNLNDFVKAVNTVRFRVTDVGSFNY